MSETLQPPAFDRSQRRVCCKGSVDTVLDSFIHWIILLAGDAVYSTAESGYNAKSRHMYVARQGSSFASPVGPMPDILGMGLGPRHLKFVVAVTPIPWISFPHV